MPPYIEQFIAHKNGQHDNAQINKLLGMYEYICLVVEWCHNNLILLLWFHDYNFSYINPRTYKLADYVGNCLMPTNLRFPDTTDHRYTHNLLVVIHIMMIHLGTWSPFLR